MKDIRSKYCSWCYEKTIHKPIKRKTTFRIEYQCSKCKNFTLICSIPGCKNMTRGRCNPKHVTKESRTLIEKLKYSWDDLLCAEHDGSVASFKMMKKKLNDIKDFRKLYERNKFNFYKSGKIIGFTIGGTLVFAPVSLLAAPGIAAALGSAGLLGAASTGTAIATLHGAALTSASLAAIGTGTMASGSVFIMAVGAGLGSITGARIGNNYIGDVKDFNIKKQKKGNDHAIIYVNGFLTQKNENTLDWKKALDKSHRNNSWYYLNWESKANYELDSTLTKASSKAIIKYAGNIAKKASRKAAKRINPVAFLMLATDLVDNPWHTAMVKAGKTGIMLADLITRSRQRQFTLMGHSLGARVMYYALANLSVSGKKKIKDVFLFGGAVDRRDIKAWSNCTKPVKGKIYNCYSKNDKILRYLYKGASGFISDPIGIGPILLRNKKIQNVDCSNIVNGHMDYKPNLESILIKINPGYRHYRPQLLFSEEDIFCPHCNQVVVITGNGEYICQYCELDFIIDGDNVYY